MDKNPEITIPWNKTEIPKEIIDAVKTCPWRVGVGNVFVCGCNNFSVCDVDRHPYFHSYFCPCIVTITMG